MRISKKIMALGLTLSLLLVNTPNAQALSSVDKIQGKDRYETAAMIADKQNYTTAILVNSDKSLADGLSASGLAGAVNAPILLTKKDTIPAPTENRLNGVKKVYIIGSDSAISTSVENKIKSKGIEVERIGGNDRLETSYKVAKEISEIKDIDKVILTNGYKGEPDAMSVSSVAARDGIPIILTNGQDINFNTNGLKTYVIGSSSVMNDNLVNKTQATRLGGIDRFDTNKKVIEQFYSGAKEFYLSNGYQLVDALTGAPLAKNTPIVLVHNGSDKNILKGATKVTALGDVDEVIIKQCLDAINYNNSGTDTPKYLNGGDIYNRLVDKNGWSAETSTTLGNNGYGFKNLLGQDGYDMSFTFHISDKTAFVDYSLGVVIGNSEATRLYNDISKASQDFSGIYGGRNIAVRGYSNGIVVVIDK